MSAQSPMSAETEPDRRPAGGDGAGTVRHRPLPPVLSKAPPVAMVIFGASGDLTARKILPALSRLADRGVLDDGFTLIGVARTPWDDGQFRSHVAEATPGAGPKWRALTDRFRYIAGEYDHPDTFSQLKEHLDEADRVDGDRRQPALLPGHHPECLRVGGRGAGRPRLHQARSPRAPSPGSWWRSPTAAT